MKKVRPCSKRTRASSLLRAIFCRDWQEQLEERRSPESLEVMATFRRLVPRLNNELKELHEIGVPLLAGSDAAVFSHFRVGGFMTSWPV